MTENSVGELLLRALAKSVRTEFTDESGAPTVCVERMIHPRTKPYFFLEALKTTAKREYSGYLIAYRVALSYCIPQPAENTDYCGMMEIAQRMLALLRVVELRPELLACWGKELSCTTDAKGISATASFTLRGSTKEDLEATENG